MCSSLARFDVRIQPHALQGRARRAARPRRLVHDAVREHAGARRREEERRTDAEPSKKQAAVAAGVFSSSISHPSLAFSFNSKLHSARRARQHVPWAHRGHPSEAEQDQVSNSKAKRRKEKKERIESEKRRKTQLDPDLSKRSPLLLLHSSSARSPNSPTQPPPPPPKKQPRLRHRLRQRVRHGPGRRAREKRPGHGLPEAEGHRRLVPQDLVLAPAVEGMEAGQAGRGVHPPVLKREAVEWSGELARRERETL